MNNLSQFTLFDPFVHILHESNGISLPGERGFLIVMMECGA